MLRFVGLVSLIVAVIAASLTGAVVALHDEPVPTLTFISNRGTEPPRIYALQGRDLQDLTAGLTFGAGEISDSIGLNWSPGRDRVIFEVVRQQISFNQENGGMERWSRELWLLDLHERSTRPITDNLHAKTRVAWSPEGDRIAIDGPAEGSTGIFVLDLTEQPIAPVMLDYGRASSRFYSGPAWSARGELAFAAVSDDDRFDIWIIDELGGVPRIIEPLRADAIIGEVAWAPDGESLVYTAAITGGGNGITARLYHVDLTTDEQHPITDFRLISNGAVWSPADDQIAFWGTYNPSREPVRAYVSDPVTETGERVSMLPALPVHVPAWSAAGDLLAFATTPPLNNQATCEIVVVDVRRGLVVRPIRNPPGVCDSTPAWR